jgi:lipocalin-like protein
MSMRESLIGTWRLVSYEAHGAHGKISYPLGKNLRGLLCYTEEGFMSVQVMKKDRPKYSSKDLHLSLVEEMAAAANGYVAYAGRFSVDEAAGTVTHHIELSLSPTWVGTDQIRSVTLRTGRLYLQGGSVLINSILQAPHTVWEKLPS